MRGTTSAAAATIRAVGAGQRQGSCDHPGGLRSRVRARYVPDRRVRRGDSRSLRGQHRGDDLGKPLLWSGRRSPPSWSSGFDSLRPLHRNAGTAAVTRSSISALAVPTMCSRLRGGSCGPGQPAARPRSCHCPRGRESLPPPSHALVLVPGVIDGADLEAGRDHGPVLRRTQGWPYSWTLTRSTLGRDTLDHCGGVLQRSRTASPRCSAAEIHAPGMTSAVPGPEPPGGRGGPSG